MAQIGYIVREALDDVHSISAEENCSHQIRMG